MGSDTLEERLWDWAREYRGGRYENIGWPTKNIVSTLMAHQGFMPDSQIARRIPIRVNADEIECAVLELLGQSYKTAWVLRVEYLRSEIPEQEKLSHLRRIGLGMSRNHYYEQLRLAKAFIAGFLRREMAA